MKHMASVTSFFFCHKFNIRYLIIWHHFGMQLITFHKQSRNISKFYDCFDIPHHPAFTDLIGHTFKQFPHRTQLSSSTTGYKKPSSSGCIEMADFGQIAQQAVQPQQSSFLSQSTGIGLSYLLFIILIILLFKCKARHKCPSNSIHYCTIIVITLSTNPISNITICKVSWINWWPCYDARELLDIVAQLSRQKSKIFIMN